MNVEQLSAEDDGYKGPIVRFLRSRNDLQLLVRLVLTARAGQIRDIVVISFRLLEKSCQKNGTESQSKSDVVSVPVPSGVTENKYNVKDGGIGN